MTARPRTRAFTDNTMSWFEIGDAIGETPQNDVYAEEPHRIRSVLIRSVAIALGCGAGVFALWLAL